MTETNLLVTCATAFVAVFVLLVLMALTIRLITFAFPERRAEGADDAAVVAAISVAVATLVPGARVAHVEEQP